MKEAEIRLRRMAVQRLIHPAASAVDVVQHMVGLQAQDRRMARLLVRPRTAHVDANAIDRACNEERSIVRTWAMRGTLHMVSAVDVRWLVGLIGPISAARGRRRRLELGLDDTLCERGVHAIADVLGGGHALTRSQLVHELAARGVVLDPRGQAPAHLLAYAAHRAVICRGPDLENDEPTYVLLAEWLGDRPRAEPADARCELARRYLTGYGPADVGDFAAWSGLPMREARQGFESAVRDWRDPVLAPSVGTRSQVRLLGHFDPYLLGYRDRAFALDERFAAQVQRGGGFIQPTVVIDGRVTGVWRQRRAGRRLEIVIEPFESIDAAATPGVDAEARDIGRFLGLEAMVDVRAPARQGR